MTETELRKIVLQSFYDMRHLGHPFQWCEVPDDKFPPVESFSQLARICSDLAEENLVEWNQVEGGMGEAVGGIGQIKGRGVRIIEGKEPLPGIMTLIDNSVKIVGSPAAIVQVGNNNNASVSMPQIDQSIFELRNLVGKASASDLEKEEAISALERVYQLAQKPKSAEVSKKAKEKLELIRSTIGIASDLGEIAAHYITLLGEFFAK